MTSEEHAALRLRHNPTAINMKEMRAGLRWTLLQAIAWIATEVESYVDLVGTWTPLDDEYPDQGASRGAGLELDKQLRLLSPHVLSFQVAQLHLFRLLKSGSVVIYVAHTEHVPVGANFTGLSYFSDCVGLLPPQDNRDWRYVVVDAQTFKAAWANDPASQQQASKTIEADNADPNAEPAATADKGPPFSRASRWHDMEEWYRTRVLGAPARGFTRDEDEAAAKSVGISREKWRELRRIWAPPSWGESGRKKVGRKDN